jgi:hypothetical protein
MQVVKVDIDRNRARELYRTYKKHRHYSTPMDQEIGRAYQLLAQGRLIIKAIESVRAAGQNEDGLPSLALARADAKACCLALRKDGSATMSSEDGSIGRRRNNAAQSKWFDFMPGTFKDVKRAGGWKDFEALMPPIPLHLRPQRGLANYHVLWEAEWTRVPPRDPYLLRRIGKADLWLVVAMWDLTEVERAALATRL